LISATSFNPRAHEGRDHIYVPIDTSFLDSFNPRAREGRDGLISTIRARPMGFNPRAREGRDFPFQCSIPLYPVSIHAPAKGATWDKALDILEILVVSIHAPAKGATPGTQRGFNR